MKKHIKLALVSFLFVATMPMAMAKVVLPKIFGSDMVLQRETQVDLWGWGAPGEEITVTTSWDQKTYNTKTSLMAKWALKLNTPKAGGPYTVSIKGNQETIVLDNVLIGEVWLASGQSNMEWSANSGLDNKEAEVAAADHPEIRLFTVDKRTATNPQDDFTGSWKVCTPESMSSFSSVGYFFARRLQEKLNVPVGIINSSWGASSAEVWTPKEVFDANDDLKMAADSIKENPWVSTVPSSLYNAMIHPLMPFTIAGAIWYQGETNTANYDTYTKLFTSMIGSWREGFHNDFPFYYVQIAPYQYGEPYQGVALREAQRHALDYPKTGMVVVSDICTVEDIHPQNKQDVGLRLGNLALKEQYNAYDGETYGPMFQSAHMDGKKALVTFDHAKGLHASTKKLEHFELAGADGVFYPAKARIKNNTIELTAKQVKAPEKVRYGWGNTILADLFNDAGLPASSFTTE